MRSNLLRPTLGSALVTLGLALVACGAPPAPSDSISSDLREITRDEARADFNQIVESFRGLYGAMERKEARYGFQFDDLVTQYRNRIDEATTEAQFDGIFHEFISRFNDAHVSLSTELVSDDAHAFSLPFSVMPIEQTFVVYAVDPSLGTSAPLRVGDEVLTIDGTATGDLAGRFAKYVGIPNALSASHVTAARLTSRPIYASNAIKAGDTAKVHVRGADGAERDASLAWSEVAHVLPPRGAPTAGESTPTTARAFSDAASEVTTGELSKLGARVPFFMTDAAKASLGVTGEVALSAAELTKFSLTLDQAAQINYFAVKYAVGAKKVLFVRLPDYEPADTGNALNYLRALIDQEQPNVDALVLDETHNPGGDIGFAQGVVSLLVTKTVNGLVQEMNADREWIQAFADAANQVRQANASDPLAGIFDGYAHTVDDAYSANKNLSLPIPIFAPAPTLDPDPVHWQKPAMMLTDELSVSCADFVPLLIKANGVAPLFGQRTMGGGGNVEQVATLTNTQGQLNISRGLGTVFDPTGAYPDANFIEDNGVTPDVSYSHTLADFRAGYVGYVAAFNAELAKHLTQ